MTDTLSIFSRIIAGELPGRFVWRDERVVAFLTIAPMRPGHTLVVPVEQIDRWTDVPADLWAELCGVSHTIGGVLQQTFECDRVGVLVAGLEVPHCHIHLVPIRSEADLSFALADHNARAEDLDAAAGRIREGLVAAGHGAVVPD